MAVEYRRSRRIQICCLVDASFHGLPASGACIMSVRVVKETPKSQTVRIPGGVGG
jgi:hypothetical protein